MSGGIEWYYNSTKGDRIANRFMSSILKLIRKRSTIRIDDGTGFI